MTLILIKLKGKHCIGHLVSIFQIAIHVSQRAVALTLYKLKYVQVCKWALDV